MKFCIPNAHAAQPFSSQAQEFQLGFNLFHVLSVGHRIISGAMDTLIFRTRPNDRNECEQWTLVRDGDDPEDFIIQEHVVFGALLSGKPYARLIRRMTVGEFLATDQLVERI